MDKAFPILVAILLVRLVATEARYQRAKRQGNNLRFPPGIGLRFVMGLGAPFMLYVAYRLAREANVTGEWWLPLIAGMLAVATILLRPAELVADERGITATWFLGLRRKVVPWNGARASFIPGLGEVVVIASDGTVIKHSSYHVGQSDFLQQLRRHNVYVQS